MPLTSLEEAFLHLAEAVTFSVHFEVRVEGRFDLERLQSALGQAAGKHPLARARVVASRVLETRRYVEIDDEPDFLGIEVVDCEDEADLTRARCRLLSRAPGLDSSPPFLAMLARDPAGDVLLLNLHHVVFDGVSAMRFMTSVARAYAGEDDPAGGPPLEEARDLRRMVGRSPQQLLTRGVSVLEDAIAGRESSTRVAADGGETGGAQFGVAMVRVCADELAPALAARPEAATVNDLLLGALALTVRRWNDDHGSSPGGRVSIIMPVNLRPREWSGEVVSNFASYVTVGCGAGVPDELAAATRAIRERTEKVKRRGAAGWTVDLLEPGNALPVQLKQRMQHLLPMVSGRFVQTTALSNLGRVVLPAFGDAGAATEVWFTPPAAAPMDVAVGAASSNGDLFVGLRHVRATIGDDAGERFGQLFRATLLEGSA